MKPIEYKWEVLGWLWLAYFFNQADRQVFNVVLSLIQSDLSLTDADLGLVATLFTLAFGLSVPIGGLIGDLASRKWAVTVSILSWSLATVATGVSSTLWQFILFRSVATGAGEAVYSPSNYALIGDYHRTNLSLAMSLHQSSNYIGIIASGAIAGYLGETYGWRSPFVVFGVLGLFVGLMMAIRLRDYRAATPHPKPSQDGRETKSHLMVTARYALGSPTVGLLALAFGGFVFVSVGYLTWMPTLMKTRYDLSLTSAGFLSLFFCHAAALIGVLAAGHFSDRWAIRIPGVRLRVQVVGLLAMCPFIVLMGIAPNLPLACVGLAGFGFFKGFYDANIVASLYDVVPERIRATAVSLLIGFAFMIGASSPWILGLLRPTIGLASGIAALSLAGIFSGAAIGAALLFTYKRDRDRANLDAPHPT